MIQRGWALAMRDAHDDEGIRQIQQGLVTFRATEAEVQLPSWLALLAEAYGHHGQVDQGLQAVHEGLAVLALGSATTRRNCIAAKGSCWYSKAQGNR